MSAWARMHAAKHRETEALTSGLKRRLDTQRCSEKVPYRARWQAEDAAERHIACMKCCTDGRRMGVYRCPADPSHFHLGHEGVRQ